MRIDKYIAQTYGFSRNKVQQFIDAGLILKNKIAISRASEKMIAEDVIEILENQKIHWVSRSAEKLHGFLEHHDEIRVKIQNAECLDVGASTGGFTQILLENGAQHIDAVDVGTRQLAQVLRQNPRVTSCENTDIREFSTHKKYDIIVCDASFISLQKILLSMKSFSQAKTIFIILFKPQFEVGKNHITKSGVPKNEKIILEAMENFEKFLWENNLEILHKEKSVLIGEAGNQEWVYALQNTQK